MGGDGATCPPPLFMGQKFLKLWNRTSEHRLKRMPLPLRIAIQIIGERNGIKSFEKALYHILRRDPEVRKIARYVTTGNVTLTGEDSEKN